MIEDGLFEKFPCDAVFAIHNKPGVPLGHIVTKPGPLLAAADRWDIRITGKGGHAAHPHLAVDPHGGRAPTSCWRCRPSSAATSIRSTPPSSRSASSRRGSAYNVIPGDVHIGGTDAHHDAGEPRAGAAPHRGDLRRRRADARRARSRSSTGRAIRRRSTMPSARASPSTWRRASAASMPCSDNVRPSMGAEDFSYMLEKVPGAMVMLGNGGGRGGQPAQLALRLQRHGDPVRRQLLRAHRRALPRAAGMSMAVIPSVARDLSWAKALAALG